MVVPTGEDPENLSPWSALIDAGSAAACLALILRGSDVNDRNNRFGQAPLAMAASRGMQKICELLLSRGAQVDLPDEHGKTALHHAAMEGSMGVCKLLLSHGADVMAHDRIDGVPLHVAANNGRYQVCELLASHGAEINAFSCQGMTALHYAVKKDDAKVCALLLEMNADPSFMPPKLPGRYLTPFLTAVNEGKDSLVQMLFDTGRVDPGFSSISGRTVQQLAGMNESTLRLTLALQSEFAVMSSIADGSHGAPACAGPKRAGGFSPL